MYWNQTVVFHLRQAATLTKEPEVLKAIRAASAEAGTRNLRDVAANVRAQLASEMARILKLDVLTRFHASAPESMLPLYTWQPGSTSISLPTSTVELFSIQTLGLEALANLWWARYLERVNILAPYIIEKVEREGATRTSLVRFLTILQSTDNPQCFYCDRPFAARTPVHVDHVIPWSYLLADPPWDLVLSCAPCNLEKSDTLPSRDFMLKLTTLNERRAKMIVPTRFGSPLIAGEQILQLYDAARAIEWPSDWMPT